MATTTTQCRRAHTHPSFFFSFFVFFHKLPASARPLLWWGFFHNGDIPAGLFFITPGPRPRAGVPSSLSVFSSSWLNNQKFLYRLTTMSSSSSSWAAAFTYRLLYEDGMPFVFYPLARACVCVLNSWHGAAASQINDNWENKKKSGEKKRTRRLALVVFAAVEINLRGLEKSSGLHTRPSCLLPE